jgi:ABC-2 type transport system permease protein
VRPYRALMRAAAKSALAYRMSFVFSLFGVLFQLIALLAVWHALLADSSFNGLTWPQMRGYLLVAFASGALVGLVADIRMAYRIRDGSIALDIVKPVSYQEARFAQVLGAVWIEIAVVVLVGTVVVLAGGPMRWPGGGQLALFVASMVLLIPLKFLVLYICGMACFWTQNYVGVQWARIAIVNLLSGALVPLALLPGWLADVAYWLPFAGMVSTPGLLFIGSARDGAAARLVLVQLAWVVVLWLAGKLLWRVALRQLTVNGG